MSSNIQKIAQVFVSLNGQKPQLLTHILLPALVLASLMSPPAFGDNWTCANETIDGITLRRCTSTANESIPDNPDRSPAASSSSPEEIVSTAITTNPANDLTNNPENLPPPTAAEKKPVNTTTPNAELSITKGSTEIEPQEKRTAKADKPADRHEKFDNCGQPAVTGAPSTPPQEPEGKLGELPVHASANEASLEKGIARYSGSVHFSSGEVDLYADEATYYTEARKIDLKGDIIVTNSEARISGDQASIDLASKSQEVSAAQYTLAKGNMRGKADHISVDKNNITQIRNGSYTRCMPENMAWEVSASKITLDRNRGQGKASHARLKLYGAPVFYLPYAQFPVGDQRQSGFLFPKLSDTNTGLDVALPYYLNLAPNFDAILSARHKAKHGYLTEAETRWLNSFDRWTIGGSHIDGDKSFNDETRWLVTAEERGRLGDHFTTAINYSKVSDTEFLRDLNTTSLSVNRSSLLSQSFNIRYQTMNWDAGSNIQLYQSIDPAREAEDAPYEQLPTAWIKFNPAAKPFRLTPSTELRYSQFNNDVLTEGARSYGHFDLTLPLNIHALRLSPEIGYQQQHYRLKGNKIGNLGPTEEKELAVGSAYGRLKLSSIFASHSDTTHKIIEPSLTYLYREITDGRQDSDELTLFDSNINSFDHYQLDALSQFVGYDIIEETNQLAIAVSHHRHAKNRVSNTAITLGQIIYFQPTQTALVSPTPGNADERRSNIVGSLKHSRKHWQGFTNLQWDSEDNSIEQAYAGIRFRSDNSLANTIEKRNIINIGYNFRRANPDFSLLADSNIEQAEFSVVRHLNSRWGLFGKYQYDLQNQRETETLGGFEYDSCCVKLRMVYRDALVYEPGSTESDERDRTIMLQLELKGLMGVGRSLEDALVESIHGYQNRF